MNERWSLEPIYNGFEDESFQRDFARLGELCDEANAFSREMAAMPHAEALKRYISFSEEMNLLTSNMYCYAMLRQSANTKDADSTSWCGRIMSRLSTVAGANAAAAKYIASMEDLDSLVEADEKLRDYRYLFQNIKRDNRYLLGEKEEEIVAKFSISGAGAWEELQGYLTSSVEVDYQGGKTTLSSIRNLAYDADANVRRAAYEAELSSYDKIKDSIAYSLNSIKMQVLSECELRGYESPLQKTLHGARMKKETLDALLGAMEGYLPKFWEYLKAKAAYLGHDNGMPWYDMFAPIGSSSKKYTTEEAKAYLLNIFGKFDKSLHDLVEKAFDNAWIDFYPREGKVGGAFCCEIAARKESRILTNFDGAFSDIVTLAHELGHAFHSSIVFNHRPLNWEYSMPVAETASTFNENVIMNAAIKEASSKEEKLALIEGQLMDATQIICDIYSRYLFETAVFENRKESFLPASALCDIMLDAQKKAYGDGLNHDFLHPYMWACKSHYYSGSLSFYNFPYAFGGLFARGLYALYEEQGEAFVEKYKKLLYTTTIADVEDTAMVAGIDLTDKAFWEKGLQSFADEIDEFVRLTKELK